MQVKYLKELKATDIYALLENVYSTADSMSEEFLQKFPNMNFCMKYFQEIELLSGGIVIFIEYDNFLCGYITIKPREQAKIKHTSELNMGVHSLYRNKGIGKELLNIAIQLAREKGILEIIYLMVRSDNNPAIRLYKNFGFEILAVLEKDTKIAGTYYDGVLMRLFV